jgi:Protein of unknown function (DUF1116)
VASRGAKPVGEKPGISAEIGKANGKAVDILNRGRAVLVDFREAGKVIPGMKEDLILHAGPPIGYAEMIAPVQVAVQGALILEGKADDLENADRLARSGDIEFRPCHEFSAACPMAGVTSASMYVAVVENPEFSNRAFCNLHEGRGKILRFGGFGDEVMKRLQWMNGVLGPALAESVRKKPVDLKVIMSKGLLMGDEFHQRFNASSLLFLREILESLMDSSEGKECIRFISEREQFFLNLSMPAAKALVDPADGIEYSTLVTRLTRNGVGYGIGVSGLKGEWFVGPAEVPKGLYFPGYTEADASGDFGDSAIMETIGLGGYASAAAPAVVRFIGGTPRDAVQMTEDGYKVCIGISRDFLIPQLDFKGVPTGIDIVKVNSTGLVPKSNTGIAHKKPGIGQIGAGVSRAPIEAFQDALRAFAQKYRVS